MFYEAHFSYDLSPILRMAAIDGLDIVLCILVGHGICSSFIGLVPDLVILMLN